jgi:hypothetical protein
VAKPAKPKAAKPGRRSPTMLAMAGVGGLLVVGWLGFSVPWLCAFVAGGFLPTIAAYLGDSSRKKFDAIAVGALSAAAMLPFVLDGLSAAGRTGGREILANAYAWGSVYVAAGFGYALCWLFPIVANVVYENRAQARIQMLERRKAMLEAEWGESVRGEDGKPPR